MELYDAGVGDVIDIPAHHPRQVMVTGWASQRLQLGMEFAQVAWKGLGPWSSWSGKTLLSERAQVVLAAPAGPDSPIRQAYAAEIEQAMAALLTTTPEEDADAC